MSSARSFGLEGIGRVLPVGIASLLGSGHIGRVGAREAEVIIHLAWRPWGRRHRGTRSPARPRARPGERRSVHKLVEMASRSRFGSIVYTVATRKGHARVAPPRGWRLCRDSNPHKPRGVLNRDWTTSTGDPSAQGSVAFSSSGASGASRDAPGSLSGPCRTTSTTFSRRTYPTHMRARRTIIETLPSTLNLTNSQNPR